MALEPDRHVTRTGEEYADALQRHLPVGQAWPRDHDSTLMKVVRGLTGIWGDIEIRASTLLEVESDPRRTIELLPDWERNWGLPDPCYQSPQNIGQRQLALVMRMTMEGAQSREFFIEIAAKIGYTITITEYRTFICGIDRCGDNRVYGDGSDPMYDDWGRPIKNIVGQNVALGELSEWPNYGVGPPENRFYWTVHVTGAALIWFRTGKSECANLLLDFGLADDLECLLNRWKPAHTQILFDYSGLTNPDDPLAGLP